MQQELIHEKRQPSMHINAVENQVGARVNS